MAKIIRFIKLKKINGWIIFYLTLYLILVYKIITLDQIKDSIVWGTYSILITFYILSRFLIAYFRIPPEENGYEPSISFVIPAKNEEKVIFETIARIYQSNYPRHKFEVIAINDGSTDETLREMLRAKRIYPLLKIVNWKKNKGKRYGMATGILRAKNEIVIFVDSDSFIDSNSVRPLVKYFVNKSVGAVAGHADVYNANNNFLTKMQAVRYYISFRIYKSAESVFGCVTCCSGCYSAYRREYVLEYLDQWLNQKFLGASCTYGDDRSLTNFLLRKYKIVYAEEAKAYTIVPDNLKQYFRQQLRWKKSWTRETLRACFFMWKKNPIAAFSFYLGFILPFAAPIVVFRALIWYPMIFYQIPIYYLMGIFMMNFFYGVYYYLKTHKKFWFVGSMLVLFYGIILIAQMPYAVLTIRDPKWGTR